MIVDTTGAPEPRRVNTWTDELAHDAFDLLWPLAQKANTTRALDDPVRKALNAAVAQLSRAGKRRKRAE